MAEFAVRQDEWRKTLAVGIAGLLLILVAVVAVCSGSYQLLLPVSVGPALVITASMRGRMAGQGAVSG